MACSANIHDPCVYDIFYENTVYKYMCAYDITYWVALVSKIDEIIGLFCKRAL